MQPLRHEDRVAVARLHALLELLPTALDRELAPTGLTSFELTLLEALHEADAGRLRLSALAARTNATLPRLSRVVTGLERKGHVERAACEDDGRATNAVLTDAGRRAYLDGRPRYDAAVRSMILDGLDERGVDDLATIAYSILGRLDPDRRLAITAAGAPDGAGCPADPADASSASSGSADDAPACPADPATRADDAA